VYNSPGTLAANHWCPVRHSGIIGPRGEKLPL